MSRHRAAAHTAPRCRPGVVTSLALLGLLTLAWAQASPVQAAAANAALAARAPGPAVIEAQRRLDATEALLRQAERAQRDTEQLQAELMRIDARWKEGDAATRSAQAATQAVDTVALPALRAARQAWADSAANVTRLTASHQAALAAAAQAPKAQRDAAMTAADTQARARAWAEQAHQAARERHLEAAVEAWRAVVQAGDRRAALGRNNEQLASQLSEAASRWAAVDDAWRALRGAVTADAAPLPPGATPAGLVPGKAPWAAPGVDAAEAPAHASAQAQTLDDWRRAARSMDDAQDATWLRTDAAAFVSQTLDPRGPCAATPCPHWRAEQHALARELAQRALAWTDAEAKLTASRAQADALPAELADRLARARAQREGMASAVAEAVGAGQLAVRALSVEGQDTQRRMADRRVQAQQRFNAAWRAQFGQDPAPPPSPARAAAPPPAYGFPAPGAGVPMPLLRQHALHRMLKRNDEPAGFGAYTYVVVGTGAGRDSPGVKQRLARLLAALQGLTPAEQVEAAQRVGTNVFVVPVLAGTEWQESLDYEIRLAQALMGHAPPAVRMPGALQRALVTSNGPFLITLPGRLAEAQASWPVLFADLNSVPAAVVADVVRSYMGDLLVGFEPTNAGWKPPALQRVALTLVRLVQGTGDVVMAAFPASVAAPPPR